MSKSGPKELLQKWFKISEQNNYYIRFGRDPGEEALDEEDRLLNELKKYAYS